MICLEMRRRTAKPPKDKKDAKKSKKRSKDSSESDSQSQSQQSEPEISADSLPDYKNVMNQSYISSAAKN